MQLCFIHTPLKDSEKKKLILNSISNVCFIEFKNKHKSCLHAQLMSRLFDLITKTSAKNSRHWHRFSQEEKSIKVGPTDPFDHQSSLIRQPSKVLYKNL